MNETNNQPNLLQNIGLALSGGGYRAAGFHLGLLSYLNRVDLLKQVTMISTVSGGTFTGAKYTLSLVSGQSFKQFYDDFYKFLKETKLVELALDKLSKKECYIPSLRTDLITAAAQVYAETFLEKEQDNTYRLGDIFDKDIHLKEIIFNATEFRTGTAFRFQSSSIPKARIGNGNISIKKDDAADIRIADIVAASSCFPGGFEPLAFPDDFNWSNNESYENIRQKVFQKIPENIALMDGGIYDNQGIESLYRADKRNEFSLELFIISDVDQQKANLYSFPPTFNISNLSLNAIDLLSKTIIILCFFTLGTVAYEAFQDYTSGQFIWLDIFLYIVPLILALGTTFILIWGRNIIQNKILPQIPQVGRFAWDDLKTLTISQVANGIYLRLSSLQAMAGSVFMKRIRNMGFRFIYKEYKDNNRDKLIPNLIYDLKTGSSLKKLPGVKEPSDKLLEVINAAVDMDTTLWFTEENQLDNLIITGQATICYNLMVYITRLHGNDPNAYPQEVKVFWNKLIADWNSLCSHPQVLL